MNQQSSSPIEIIAQPTETLLHLYGILMSSFNANAHSFKSSTEDGQQLFSPDLNTTLSVYKDLLDANVIKQSPPPSDSSNSNTEIGVTKSSELQAATFEMNIVTQQTNSRLCTITKKELLKRATSDAGFDQAALQCWQTLNQAYCFNAIAYRFESFGIDPGERQFTTAEYIDFKELAGQLSIDWINTLCQRAFIWSAGKQKENRLPDKQTTNLAISSVLRQFAWALEEEPLGKPFGRPKTLVVFGLERIFKDFFDITPANFL